MKIKILWVGKTRSSWIQDGISDYLGRIRRYCPVETVEVRDEKGAEAEEMRRRECERLERQIPAHAVVVLLDERGDQPDSRGLALQINRHREDGITDLVFVIGGAFGFSDQFRRRGCLLSLSRMTLTHQMVRVFLLEQIYRAFTILNNEPYHHD